MKAPLSWLRELADIPAGSAELAVALTDAGLQVEHIEDPCAAIDGPVVVGRVLEIDEALQTNGKLIRWCHIDVGQHNPPGEVSRGIVCGAHNFVVGDYVVVALTGTVLPGGFLIAARKTYGHISDGMICAEDELGLGDDHTGIIVLPSDTAPAIGGDALELLGAKDVVFDIELTPDEGHCLSLRGLAREAAAVTGGSFTDPYATVQPSQTNAGYPVVLDSPACQLFSAIRVRGVDPSLPSPSWMVKRLRACGMRHISLPVDIANYVMLESGQPLHTYDATTLAGPIVVRQARPGETLITLDKVTRTLSVDDLLITDDSGPIGLAGVMGGLTTEMTPDTTDVLIEAAWFAPASIGRTYRRHKLPSEASRRFERGVDQGVGFAAGWRAAELLRDLAGGVIDQAYTVAGIVAPMPRQRIEAKLVSKILGFDVPQTKVAQVLTASGVTVDDLGDGWLSLVPPTWRRDLVDPYDYVEEVGRKLGFKSIPSRVPTAPAGRGYTPEQRMRRAIGQAVAQMGLSEVITLPFINQADLDKLGLEPTDERRQVVALANPLSDAQPNLRTTVLPGLLAAVNTNTSRSIADVAIFELGAVFFQVDKVNAISPAVGQRPSQAEIDELLAALPRQPRHLGAVLTGNWRQAGWDGPAQAIGWQHGVAVADVVAQAVGLKLSRQSASVMPWHPGRCAQLGVITEDGVFTGVGYAGQLHPEVVKAWGLPAGACAVELDIDALCQLALGVQPGRIAALSSHPGVKQDVALVVDQSVSADALAQALRVGAGDLLESLSLFDVYTGAQLGPGKKSLAYSMVFRAPDRTLTETQASAARDAAVAWANRAVGAVIRS